MLGVGIKWLCGPYGTGFLWVRPDLLRSLNATQAYWLAQMTAADLGREEPAVRRPTGPPTSWTFDVFGTANVFNFKPWAAAAGRSYRIAKVKDFITTVSPWPTL